MLSRIHSKLGTAGLVVAVVALVAALTGTALAAKDVLTKPEEKQVIKIAKKYAGKPGATGAQGPAGANGTNGAKGATGPKGATGEKGTNGTNGTNGTSAKGTAFTGEKTVGSVTCKSGGVEIESASPKTAVCNGETGFTETLPKGKTETGTWAAAAAGGVAINPLSFNIPLKTAPKGIVAVGVDVINPITEAKETNVTKVYGSGSASDCEGSVAAPTATEGVLCVYESRIDSSEGAWFLKEFFEELYKRTTSGGTLAFFFTENARVLGTWAVTAS